MADIKADRYFEDYLVADMREIGKVRMSEAEMIEFAVKYDPQDFHIDPEKAASGPYNGLIASGWHSVAVVMRLLVDRYLSSASSLGSPGVDELRWLAPVRPADELTVWARVVETRRLRSKPDRGLVHSIAHVYNQDDVKVLSMKAVNIIACREPTAPRKPLL